MFLTRERLETGNSEKKSCCKGKNSSIFQEVLTYPLTKKVFNISLHICAFQNINTSPKKTYNGFAPPP